MIRQFLNTTVENLRSFLASFASGESRPSGAPVNHESRPSGAPVNHESRPGGAPVNHESRPGGAPVNHESRPGGAPSYESRPARPALPPARRLGQGGEQHIKEPPIEEQPAGAEATHMTVSPSRPQRPRRAPRPAHAFPTQSVSPSVASPGTPTGTPPVTDEETVTEQEATEQEATEQEATAEEATAAETPPIAELESSGNQQDSDGSYQTGNNETGSNETGNNGTPPAFGELQAMLESLLFVASEPVAASQLARTLDVDEATVTAALQGLAQTYNEQNRGLRVQAYREKYQIVTAPAAANHVERFLNLDSGSKLSGPALETLAVVAYRQPVTRSQIEAVRGVDCAAVLRSLVQRGLIEEVGRLDVAGRPILYGVTDLFMQHFGLTDLAEMPPLEQTEADTLWAATALAELEGSTEDGAGADTVDDTETDTEADTVQTPETRQDRSG